MEDPRVPRLPAAHHAHPLSLGSHISMAELMVLGSWFLPAKGDGGCYLPDMKDAQMNHMAHDLRMLVAS